MNLKARAWHLLTFLLPSSNRGRPCQESLLAGNDRRWWLCLYEADGDPSDSFAAFVLSHEQEGSRLFLMIFLVVLECHRDKVPRRMICIDLL